MDEAPILICYDGSKASERAIDLAAKLLGKRRAIVLDVAPQATAVESIATLDAIVPSNAFGELNAAVALGRARAGAEHAQSAGFESEARGEAATRSWEGIVEVADEVDAAAIVIAPGA